VDDARVGSVLRAVRIKRGWRQADVASRARVSDATVSRFERGHLESLSALRRVATALDVRMDLVPRWRGGDLDRMLNAGHAALHEHVSRWFALRHRAWQVQHEVSFSIWGERGVIDVLAWQERAAALLVIELKTAVVDVNELLGTLDRKRRLAPRIARERGREPAAIGVALVILDTSTNRRRVAAHAAVLRSTLANTPRELRAWLQRPRGSCAAIVFVTPTHVGRAIRPVSRVRCGSRPSRLG
jgi:transcriptional regulator with XRE-family HTH domain